MPKLLYRSTMPRPDDKELVKAFTEAISAGLPISGAATTAGISEQTARDWILRGDQDLETGVASPHADFAWAFKQAQAALMRDKMAVVQADIAEAPVGKRWVPAMTVLERRFPEHYGRRQYMDVHEERNINVTVTLPPGAVPALASTLGNAALLAPGEVEVEAEVEAEDSQEAE